MTVGLLNSYKLCLYTEILVLYCYSVAVANCELLCYVCTTHLMRMLKGNDSIFRIKALCGINSAYFADVTCLVLCTV